MAAASNLADRAETGPRSGDHGICALACLIRRPVGRGGWPRCEPGLPPVSTEGTHRGGVAALITGLIAAIAGRTIIALARGQFLPAPPPART